MNQDLYNIVLGVAATLGGWWMKVIWDEMKSLQRSDKALSNDLGQLKVLVAGDYVPKAELERVVDALFKKLDRIEDKLDGKADK